MADPQRHYILFYEYVEDVLQRRGPYREEHLARISTGKESGRIIMAGPLGDPPHAAVIIFAGPEPGKAEEFAREDPYVQAGLVSDWRVEAWTVV